jgi:hypothetical protein
VVIFRVDRVSAILKTFDEVRFPQRTMPVEQAAV